MNKRQIDRFFRVLDTELQHEAGVVLTGAAAGAILGSVRPSMDIDFEIGFSNPGEVEWEQVEAAISNTGNRTGISANFAEDIDRWGMITMLDYRKNTTLYRKYGKLTVRVLDPAYWSIGKMTRFIDPDIQDMIQVFRIKKPPVQKLLKVWGRALEASPRSAELAVFRSHVESFLKFYGKKIWGVRFDPDKSIREFHKAAGIRG